MSNQPIDGGQYTRIAATGTTVVVNRGATLQGFYSSGYKVGTVFLHDAATAAGTTATSLVFSIPHTASETENVSFNTNTKFRNGIVAQATGTPEITLIWD